MNAIDKLGLTRNGRVIRDRFVGALLRERDGNKVEIKFAYGIVSSVSYAAATSAMPGHEYVQPAASIRTIRTDLPFAKGDKIRLQGGEVMTVETITPEIYTPDSNRTDALVLSLLGGIPHGS